MARCSATNVSIKYYLSGGRSVPRSITLHSNNCPSGRIDAFSTIADTRLIDADIISGKGLLIVVKLILSQLAISILFKPIIPTSLGTPYPPLCNADNAPIESTSSAQNMPLQAFPSLIEALMIYPPQKNIQLKSF